MLTWRSRVRRATRSSVGTAARPAARSRRRSSVGSAASTAPAPLRPRRPEPDRMLKARHCICKSRLVTTQLALPHSGELTGSLSLVYEDVLHAQGTGYSTGVLATCAAKTGQHVLRGIVTLSLRRCREVGDFIALSKYNART